MRPIRSLPVALVLALLTSVTAGPALADDARPGVRGGPDAAVTLDQVQARGTHNSYKLDPRWPGRELLGFDYQHQRLSRQLEEQDVRQVEIDVHWNWARGEFEVYHAWLGDDHTTCHRLTDCLAEIRWWSQLRPGHHPIMLLIEPKDGGPPRNTSEPADGDPFTHPIGEREYRELDRVLREAFDGSLSEGGRVLTPDDVTAPGVSLRGSIVERGWPRVDDLRGTVLYVIDGHEHGRDYSRGWTSLEGRTAFVQAEPFQDVAAFVSRDGHRLPGEGKYDRIRRLVADGFLVRDLAGPSGFEAAKAAGVHFISSDFPEELALSEHPHAPSRCNPVTATARCRDLQVERRAKDAIELPDEPDESQLEVLAGQVVDRLARRSVESATTFAERSADDPQLVAETAQRQLEVWTAFVVRITGG
jgi:hypothetical protein